MIIYREPKYKNECIHNYLKSKRNIFKIFLNYKNSSIMKYILAFGYIKQ